MSKYDKYVLAPSPSSFPALRYQIIASYAVSLPSIKCPECGIWSSAGIAYPSMRDRAVLETVFDLGENPVDVDKWPEITKRIRSVLNDDRYLEPGAAFGPLDGEFYGNPSPLMWVNPWTPLISRELYDRLQSRDIEISVAPAQLKGMKHATTILELEIWPLARLAIKDISAKTCKICGRFSGPAPSNLVLSTRYFNFDAPLQRIIELPTFIVCDAGLVDVLRTFPGADFTATPVSFNGGNG